MQAEVSAPLEVTRIHDTTNGTRAETSDSTIVNGEFVHESAPAGSVADAIWTSSATPPHMDGEHETFVQTVQSSESVEVPSAIHNTSHEKELIADSSHTEEVATIEPSTVIRDEEGVAASAVTVPAEIEVQEPLEGRLQQSTHTATTHQSMDLQINSTAVSEDHTATVDTVPMASTIDHLGVVVDDDAWEVSATTIVLPLTDEVLALHHAEREEEDSREIVQVDAGDNQSLPEQQHNAVDSEAAAEVIEEEIDTTMLHQPPNGSAERQIAKPQNDIVQPSIQCLLQDGATAVPDEEDNITQSVNVQANDDPAGSDSSDPSHE